MYPTQTIPLNLNFRQNQAHFWRVRMMPQLLMSLALPKKIFQQPKTSCWQCTPLRQKRKSVCSIWKWIEYPFIWTDGQIVKTVKRNFSPKCFAQIKISLFSDRFFSTLTLKILAIRSDIFKFKVSQRTFMAWRFQKGPNCCCSTMGSFKNRWFYEKLIFSSFCGRNLLKNLSHAVRPTVHPISLWFKQNIPILPSSSQAVCVSVCWKKISLKIQKSRKKYDKKPFDWLEREVVMKGRERSETTESRGGRGVGEGWNIYRHQLIKTHNEVWLWNLVVSLCPGPHTRRVRE